MSGALRMMKKSSRMAIATHREIELLMHPVLSVIQAYFIAKKIKNQNQKYNSSKIYG